MKYGICPRCGNRMHPSSKRCNDCFHKTKGTRVGVLIARQAGRASRPHDYWKKKKNKVDS